MCACAVSLLQCQTVLEIDATTTPNVLIFLVDDLRWDALSAVGHPFATTPNIDRLAFEGILFENAFVVQSVCSKQEDRATA